MDVPASHAADLPADPPPTSASLPEVHALRGARLFDGVHVLETPVVTIAGGRIAAVGAPPPAGAGIVELGDVTLLPGLVDTHVHLCFDGAGTLEEQVAGRSDDELLARARVAARRALDAGITTVRDLGDRSFVTLALRDDPTLPTVLASGPPLTRPDGHCWFLGGGCTGSDELVQAVHERARRGCDVVKVMVTGGALTPAYPMWETQLSLAELRAVVGAARQVGLPVAAHCHGVGGIELALEAQVDTIEHCSFFTSSQRAEPTDDLVERIAASGIVVSATLGRLPGAVAPPMIEASYAVIVDAVGRLLRAGANVVVGTDAGVGPPKPHDVLPHAVRDLAGSGVRGVALLRMLTTDAAAACGVGGRKGRLAAGFDADVLAVAGDPVADPASLLDVQGVWRQGVRVR